jgi:hypothetical protein
VLVTEDGDDGDGLRLIAQRKANLGPCAPIERHRIGEVVLPDTFDPETGERVVTSRMAFVEIADDVTPSDVLGSQATTKTETAETLLAALLADGEWHESGGVKKLLEAAGFNEKLAQRVAKTLGVEHERRDFPAVTWWRLPVATSPVATSTGSLDVATGENGSTKPFSSRDKAPVTNPGVATGETAQPSGSSTSQAPVATSSDTELVATASQDGSGYRKPRWDDEIQESLFEVPE